LTIPFDIAKDLKMISEKDIKVCGNFPIDLINIGEADLKFKIIGKIIKTDTNNAIGSVPLFYVEHWEKFY